MAYYSIVTRDVVLELQIIPILWRLHISIRYLTITLIRKPGCQCHDIDGV